MANLTRTGIFKARPLSWRVKTFQQSEAVAITLQFVVLAQLDGSEWVSWEGAEEHTVWGDFFVVRKTGQPNETACKQLVECLGWGKTLSEVVDQAVAPVEVQITVKCEAYNGQDYYKVTWMNPGDYEPTPGGADATEVAALDARFGSLLRAAGGPPKPKQVSAAAPPRQAPPPPKADAPDMSQIPF